MLVDRSQVQQVLINLTVNSAQAIVALGRPGSIRIEARPSSGPTGPTVRISISDDGPGVPAAIIDRLFMPFVTTKEPGSGTGLGLSVSFGIIASHGGTLRHEPTPGGGATFVIELPVGRDRIAAEDIPNEALSSAIADRGRARSQAHAAPAVTGAVDHQSMPTAAESGAPATASGRPLRVLVLDDEPSIRDFLGRVLARCGYEPILVGTGAAALVTVRGDPPDAILCDHRMAGMSGIEFHAAVSEIDPDLGHRFAFMSGDVLNPELLDFATAHGVQLLAKPFDIAAVGSLVADLVGDRPG
jgi:two-component system NtrC family sensor kinase